MIGNAARFGFPVDDLFWVKRRRRCHSSPLLKCTGASSKHGLTNKNGKQPSSMSIALTSILWMIHSLTSHMARVKMAGASTIVYSHRCLRRWSLPWPPKTRLASTITSGSDTRRCSLWGTPGSAYPEWHHQSITDVPPCSLLLQRRVDMAPVTKEAC